MSMSSNLNEVLKLFLPEGALDWFDVIKYSSDADTVYITLEEKDNPPLEEIKAVTLPSESASSGLVQVTGKEPVPVITARKFHNITLADFPVRGKRCLLTFRRRYWRIEGQVEYLKRDIKLAFPGTKLASEFAAFLKGDSRFEALASEHYSRVQ